jgi:hypothetical protein
MSFSSSQKHAMEGRTEYADKRRTRLQRRGTWQQHLVLLEALVARAGPVAGFQAAVPAHLGQLQGLGAPLLGPARAGWLPKQTPAAKYHGHVIVSSAGQKLRLCWDEHCQRQMSLHPEKAT